jgi:hypothetical protein
MSPQYDSNIHLKVDIDESCKKMKCTCCGIVFENNDDAIIHFGYHGSSMQPVSEYNEHDFELGESGLAFSMQAIIEKHIFSKLSKTFKPCTEDKKYISRLTNTSLTKCIKKQRTNGVMKKRKSINSVSTDHLTEILSNLKMEE